MGKGGEEGVVEGNQGTEERGYGQYLSLSISP